MNFRTLDLNLLRVFDAVMVERHVTRAAAGVSMTQPAVSNALRRLREAIGEELFIPGATGVTPTRRAQAHLLEWRPLPFELPRINVAMLWHRRHEHDPAQHWLRAALLRTASQVAQGLPSAAWVS